MKRSILTAWVLIFIVFGLGLAGLAGRSVLREEKKLQVPDPGAADSAVTIRVPLRLLPVGKRFKGPLQHLLPDLQVGQFPQPLPVLRLRADFRENFRRGPVPVPDRIGKIVKLDGRLDGPLIFIFPEQKI